MSDNEFEPTKHDDVLGDKYEHPSFGTICFNRISGTPRALFGSSVEHNNTVYLEVSTAHLWRGSNMDRIHPHKPIVQVEMSATQFADAITSLNAGSGVPVTIRWITGDEKSYRPEPPFQNKVKQFNNEFQKDINNITKEFDTILSLAEETKAQKRLIFAISQLKMHIKNNLPFVNEQFSEQMEHTVKEAKGEVDAFINNMVRNYGIEAIRQQAPQLQEEKQLKQLKENNKNDDN